MGKLLIILFLIPQMAFGFNCKRGKGITKTEQGYLYKPHCHIGVGKLLKENSSQKEEIVELRKTITLKDLAVTQHMQRVELWQTSTFKLEDRINTYRKLDRFENTLWFILGIAVTGSAVFGASKLR